MRMQSFKQKNDKVRVVEEVLDNPKEYEIRMRCLIDYLKNKKGMLDIFSLENCGLIEELLETSEYETRYRVLPIREENRKDARRIFLKYFEAVFGDVLSEEKKDAFKNETKDTVSGFFAEIMLKRDEGLGVFHPFVLELYNTWEKRFGELGRSTVYGVVDTPTFMGEMLAKFILEEREKAEEIDFTDKKFPLRGTVAKECFGKLWKQKMLFLDLLQKMRMDGKISHKTIESFVDKTFAKNEKRAFIIKAFVEMAKNRGFELGKIDSHEQKIYDSFITSIREKKFSEKLTESEIMQGVEGFSWDTVYRIEEIEKTEPPAPKPPDRLRVKHGKVDNPYPHYFLRLMIRIGERNEISVPELGKFMEQVGYTKNRNGTFSSSTVRSVVHKLEERGIKITFKYELCDEEKKLLIEKTEGREKIRRNEIKEWLMENGRVLDNFIGMAVSEGVKFVKQYRAGISLNKPKEKPKHPNPIRSYPNPRFSGVNNPSATKLWYVMERIKGKREITLPELGRIMEEAGYAKRKGLLINNAAAEKVMRAIEREGIVISCKKELSPQEKELLLEYARRKGMEYIRYKEIKQLLIKNGRVIDYYIANPSKEALEFLRENGYNAYKSATSRFKKI